jgi:hypothetical protein
MLSLLRKAISFSSRRKRASRGALRRSRVRTAALEQLEERALLASLPFGAMPDDTAEYMLGDVYVTVVFMESQPVAFGDPNLEDWTPASIAATKASITQGLQWWVDTLAQHPASAIRPQPLNFQIDFTYADNPVNTSYEPISRISNDFQLWIYDFLDTVVTNPTGDFSKDIRTFNNAQRLAHNTDWAFTMFVVNSENDPDDAFASGGSFSRAFAYSGGRFFVSPSERPPSTFAHETGHMFWAFDEYLGSGANYTDTRGYYNTQNVNAANNPAPGFTHVDSIMSTGLPLQNAYANHTSSPSSLEMIGWRDSDGNGIMDVLDVPHTLSGSGRYDSASGRYRFLGSSSVQTLPNQNPAGLQNDITINKITHAQYRVNGTGAWQSLPTVYNAHQATLDLSIPLAAGFTTIEIRTIDQRTGVTSAVFIGRPDSPSSVPTPGVSGFVRNDADGNGVLSAAEMLGLSGWTVQLLDNAGQPLDLNKNVEPDDYSEFARLNQVKIQVTLRATGSGVFDDTVLASVRSTASTGTKVFGHILSGNGTTTSAEWTQTSRNLRIDFSAPVSTVSLDAVSNSNFDYGRLEIYDASNRLLGRYTTKALANGQFETMTLTRPTADIAYAIAKGHAGTAVQFDNLQFGPKTTTVTDSAGAYTFASLPSGTFTVQVAAPSGFITTTAPAQTVTFTTGTVAGGIDFGGLSSTQLRPWQNPSNRFDVDGNGRVAPIDVFILIDDLRRNGARQLGPAPSGGVPYFLDVSGDNFFSNRDVFEVIDFLRTPAAAGEGSSPGTSGGGSSEGGAGEGELAAFNAVVDALLAARYTYAPENWDDGSTRVQDHNDDHVHHDELADHRVASQPTTFRQAPLAALTPSASLSVDAAPFVSLAPNRGNLLPRLNDRVILASRHWNARAVDEAFRQDRSADNSVGHDQSSLATIVGELGRRKHRTSSLEPVAMVTEFEPDLYTRLFE